jgi:hypothetical protein
MLTDFSGRDRDGPYLDGTMTKKERFRDPVTFALHLASRTREESSVSDLGSPRDIAKLAALWAITVFLACRQDGDASNDAKFIGLYVELKLASVASAKDPGKANEVQRAILAQHGITPAEFHDRFLRLANHPDDWRSFQERVIDRMNTFQKEHKGDLNGR